MPGLVDAAGRPRRALPASTLARLTELPEPRRADAHAFAIIMSLVNHAHTEAEAYGLLVDTAHPGGLAVQRRHHKGAGNARRWVHRQWVSAQNKVAANPPVGDEREVRAVLARIEHAVEDRSDLWRGQAGASPRAVVLGILYFAVTAKNTTLRVSERQAAPQVGCRAKKCPSVSTCRSPDRIVGYSIDAHMTSQLAVDALRNVLVLRGPVDTVVHSDRGSQGGLNRPSQHLDREVLRCRAAQSRGRFVPLGARSRPSAPDGGMA